ncbi:MAG: DUF3124 domain-containing protein [Syntrophobacteraceae bacterium]
MKLTRLLTIFFVLMGMLLTLAGPVQSDVKRVRGQTVYVPAYSHIYHGDRDVPFYLTVTISIRNTDPVHPIKILSVQYFDTDGKLLKSHLNKEVILRPIGSIEFVIKESEKEGGAGANFLVKWESEKEVTEPIIECIMISTATQQGLSFSSRGQAIEEH